MKRVLSVALVILLLLSSFAIAESADKAATLVSSITLSESDAVINKGKTLKLTAEIGPAEAKNKKVNWSSTDVNIASVNNGTVSGKACGECDIICEAADGSGVKAVCHVNVIQMVTSLTAKPQKLTIPFGGSSSEVEVKIAPQVVTNPVLSWSSSDESICTVDENGVITAVGAGDCEISCTTTDGSNKSVAVKVHVPCFSIGNGEYVVDESNKLVIPWSLSNAYVRDMTVKTTSKDTVICRLLDDAIEIYALKPGKESITISNGLNKLDSISIKVSSEYGICTNPQEGPLSLILLPNSEYYTGSRLSVPYIVLGSDSYLPSNFVYACIQSGSSSISYSCDPIHKDHYGYIQTDGNIDCSGNMTLGFSVISQSGDQACESALIFYGLDYSVSASINADNVVTVVPSFSSGVAPFTASVSCFASVGSSRLDIVSNKKITLTDKGFSFIIPEGMEKITVSFYVRDAKGLSDFIRYKINVKDIPSAN